MARVPWVVAVWRPPGGPGAGGGVPSVDEVHVFPSAAAWEAFARAVVEKGVRGRWVCLWEGDPRPNDPEWDGVTWDYAPDRVYRHDEPKGV